MLEVAWNYLLHFLFGDKELLDSKQTCNTYNAHDGAYGIGMIDDNVSWNSEDKNLQNVCGSKVHKHAYKLKTDYYAKYILKEVLAVCKMSVYLEIMYKYLRHLGKE